MSRNYELLAYGDDYPIWKIWVCSDKYMRAFDKKKSIREDDNTESHETKDKLIEVVNEEIDNTSKLTRDWNTEIHETKDDNTSKLTKNSNEEIDNTSKSTKDDNTQIDNTSKLTKHLIVTIRGVNCIEDMKVAMDFDLVSYEGNVYHRGVYNAALRIFYVIRELKLTEYYDITVTGFSLGASTALMLQEMLVNSKLESECICFAPFPITNIGNEHLPDTKCYILNNDIVPRLDYVTLSNIINMLMKSEESIYKYKGLIEPEMLKGVVENIKKNSENYELVIPGDVKIIEVINNELKLNDYEKKPFTISVLTNGISEHNMDFYIEMLTKLHEEVLEDVINCICKL